jgi:serine/threonine protein kinase
MDEFLSDSLRAWRLKTQHEPNGDRYHESPAGTEVWRQREKLGGGSFGVVYKEECLLGPTQNAVRAVKHIPKWQRSFSKSSQRELEALITFSDAHVPEYEQHFVRCLGWFDDATHLYITMDFIEGGDLQKYINIQRSLPEREAASITAQTARALQYMHQRGFAHRDLKPLNILVSKPGPKWHVKVADFGLARHVDGTAPGTSAGTHGYMAPELLDSSEGYTSAIDVWALGAVVFCMRTGSSPFPNPFDVYDYKNSQTKFPARALGSSSGFCMNFVLGAMTVEPGRRFTVEQVLAHDWLTFYPDSTDDLGIIDTEATTTAPPDSTWDIQPASAWSNTYNGDSTVRRSQMQPTVIPVPAPAPGSRSQHTIRSRTQLTPANALQNFHQRLPPAPAVSQSIKAGTLEPPTVTRRPVSPYRPSPPVLSRPPPARADTASTTTSSRTETSDEPGSGYSTVTSIHSPPVSPPAPKSTTYTPQMTATAYPSQVWDRYEQHTVISPPQFKTAPRTTPANAMSNVATVQASTDADPYLTCGTCNKTFKQRPYLLSHTGAIGHEPQVDDSSQAQKDGSSDTSSNTQTAGNTRAAAEVTQASTDPYLTCGTCKEPFKARSYLMAHARLLRHLPETGHNPQAEERSSTTPAISSTTSERQASANLYLTCGTCNQTFKDRQYLMRHVNKQRHAPRVRINDPRLTCLACHKTFKRRSDLFEHITASGHARDLVTGEPEVVDPHFTCLACHKTFQRRRHLFEHLDASGHSRDL